MLKSKNLQIAIMMVIIYGWENLVADNTNNGVTISNEEEDCYCSITDDESTWLTENYPTNEGVEELGDEPNEELEADIAANAPEIGGDTHEALPL